MPPTAEIPRQPHSRLEAVEQLVREKPAIAGFASYDWFNGLSEIKDTFKANQMVNPVAVYPALDSAGLRDLIGISSRANQSLVTLLGSTVDRRVVSLFNALEYRQSEMFMVYMATQINDATLSPQERHEAAAWFKQSNEQLYGVPHPAITGALARNYILPHLAADFAGNPIAAQMQQELREQIGTFADTGHEMAILNQPAQRRFAGLVRERFDGMVAHVIPRHDGRGAEEKYKVDDVITAMQTALHSIGATQLGWRCVRVPDGNLISVAAHERLVKVGARRKSMTAAVLQGKIVHEVGVHVQRALNAERAGWLSAAYGQDGYLDFEEALANAAGQVYWRDSLVAGPEYRYLIAGFARGMDGNPPRDFRQCYEIMWRIIALDRRDKDNFDLDKAKETAFLQCMRMFRGTPCNIPGLLYLKDLAYVHGRELAYPVLELVRSQADIDLLLAGKLDVTKKDHLKIAEDIVPGAPLASALHAIINSSKNAVQSPSFNYQSPR